MTNTINAILTPGTMFAGIYLATGAAINLWSHRPVRRVDFSYIIACILLILSGISAFTLGLITSISL